MNANELFEKLKNASGPAPVDLSPEQKTLWLAQAGDWHGAHDIAQDLPDPNGAWLHAYLHRQEGDIANAGYWYHRANRPTPPASQTIEHEWIKLAQAFC